jgi:adenylate cyclase class IV
MEARDTSLSALVSLSCWDSSARVEPLTPSPRERMRTVDSLVRLHLPTFIAIRPVLPHVGDAEYAHIFTAGMLAGADGFVLGPLYADDRGQFVRDIPPELLASTPHRRGTVSWSAHALRRSGTASAPDRDATGTRRTCLSLIRRCNGIGQPGEGGRMIEVELKFALTSYAYLQIQEQLSQMQRGFASRNLDRYYDTEQLDLLRQAVFVRVRNQQRLEFKFNEQRALAHTQSTERAFSLAPEPVQAFAMNTLFARFLPHWHPAHTVVEALHQNRLTKLAQIENNRLEYRYDDLLICLDHVEGLGDFLEIEAQCKEGSATDQAEARIRRVAARFSAQPLRVGYVELWLQKHAPYAYQKGVYHV